MAGMAEAVRRLRIVQTFDTPGAAAAIKANRDFGAAVRENASLTTQTDRATTAAERSIGRLTQRYREQARALQESAAAQRAVAAVRGEAGSFAGTAAGIAAGYAGYVAAAAGIAYLVGQSGKAVEAFTKFEAGQVTLQNALRATDGAVGRTAGQIEALVREIGSIDEARKAAQGVVGAVGGAGGLTGDQFERTLRLAKDLSASGFGGLEQSAKMVAEALVKPKDGLAALEAAGIRFGARQRATIVDMVETGRAAAAQEAILRRLTEAVGGAGAARDATLSGAMTALADASQRSAEQLGRQIVEATRLTQVVQVLAGALNALNDFRLSPDAARALGSFGAVPVVGPIAFAASKLLPTEDPVAKKRAADMAQAQSIADSFGPMRQQKDAYDTVVISLEKEIAALKKSETARAVEKAQREAGVAATSAEGQTIARLVTQREAETKAQQEAEEARRRAQQQAERNAEFERRTAEQRQTAIDKLMQEREALFMSEQAARAAALAQAELAKYRERGIAASADQERQIRAWAEQIAQIEAVNRRIVEAKSLATDFASSFVREIRSGATAMEALGSALDRLTDRLLDKALTSAIDNLFGTLGRSGGGGALSSILSLFGSADGNVFAGGNVVPFARGGVVTAPTIFPMATGAGLMGEAGPEAVMPLRRTPDGRLGVAASGGGSVTISPVVNVSMPAGAQSGDGERFGAEISKAIVATVRQELVAQRRQGGLLAG